MNGTGGREPGPGGASGDTRDWRGWLEHAEEEAGSAGASQWLDRIVSRVLDGAGLRSGDRVVDLGAGTGRLAIPAARAVGPSGVVTAVDGDEGCLARLHSRCSAGGLCNVVTVHGRLEDLPLISGSFSSAICRSAITYSTDIRAAAGETARVLEPGGRFSIFEPLLGELSWEGCTGELKGELELFGRLLRSSGAPHSVDRRTIREAVDAAGLEAGSLVVHFDLHLRGRRPDDLAREFLHDLPGGISTFSVLKGAGLAEERIRCAAEGFARGASDGRIRGRLPCLFVAGRRVKGRG